MRLNEFRNIQNRMDLACLLKIQRLPITCDTILITTTSTFDVKHFNTDHPSTLKNIIQEFQSKYKIVLIADDEEIARSLYQKSKSLQIESTQDVYLTRMDQQKQNHQLLAHDYFQNIMGKMVKQTHQKSQLYHLNKNIASIECKMIALKQWIECKSVQQKQSKMPAMDKKNMKVMKVKQKQYQFLNGEKQRLQNDVKTMERAKKLDEKSIGKQNIEDSQSEVESVIELIS